MPRFELFEHSLDIRTRAREWRQAHETVALVPTMGNLHEGHLSLVRLARNIGDRVVVSIFVNPTQFGPNEDFAAYPRTLDEDRARLEAEQSADALFVPSVAEIYPFGIERAVRLEMPALARELCGASRPGHFDGVAGVVCRLVNIVEPTAIVLGRKDYQQLVLIERLIADLGLGVHVAPGPTQRHSDGLAMSSRNRYLTTDERRRAPALHAALGRVREAVRSGRRDFAVLAVAALEELRAAGFEPEYVEVRRAADLGTPAETAGAGELVALGAGRLGRARLIDNVMI